MSYERKIAANQTNAKQSTGPRTVAGKGRSSRNAVKHGLAVVNCEMASDEARRLAIQICGERSDPILLDRACAIVNEQHYLRKIRSVRVALLDRVDLEQLGSRSHTLADINGALAGLAKLERYELRSLSRQRRALIQFAQRELELVAISSVGGRGEANIVAAEQCVPSK